MTWNAQDGGVENQETKATMISVWDEKDGSITHRFMD